MKPYHLWKHEWNLRGYYAKWNKSKTDKCHMISYVESNKQNKNRVRDTENKWVVACGGRGWGSEIDKQEQEVQTSSYKRISH